jgi:hypothetical protein
MNPWAFIALAAGILLIIIGVKGTQHNIATAVTGKASTAKTTASKTQAVV